MRKKKAIHIGTSGWHYKHWKDNFYPKKIKPDQFFNYYLKKFTSVEINNSFYQLPKKSTLQGWNKKAPNNFIFSVKASRYITHVKKLKDPKESVKKFFKAIKPLEKKIGPILFQLPPAWKLNAERLEKFLQVLPKGYKYTFEFRNQQWFDDKIYKLLEKYNAAFCIYDLAGILSPKKVTADFIYIRLHGPGKAYQGDYDKKKLKNWAKNFSRWKKEKKEVFCYFDNDQSGFAAKNALELKNLIN
ncbi:MAG: DUF72 domain-containing protein [Candidatus Omnitrophica bacterium]|nr:DUF72 domain-containing protein [Candidatus Omnitrophota bacterium]MCF7876782.1 DUF72 domain-containing protein [Candidatus Omnitrophota bacterium]MCF7878228.1 DUF72 domain-containing protein [Candidatus Omnitrophota bacterium]